MPEFWISLLRLLRIEAGSSPHIVFDLLDGQQFANLFEALHIELEFPRISFCKTHKQNSFCHHNASPKVSYFYVSESSGFLREPRRLIGMESLDPY